MVAAPLRRDGQYLWSGARWTLLRSRPPAMLQLVNWYGGKPTLRSCRLRPEGAGTPDAIPRACTRATDWEGSHEQRPLSGAG
jgi:hypothetical protein